MDLVKYVVLSNASASISSWDNVAEISSVMNESGVKKEPGHCMIEIQREAHFLFMEKTVESYQLIEDLTCVLKDMGYLPDISGLSVAVIKSNKDTRSALD
ncbi:unnamed protein product [Coffea canephora]|uniref:DH200=94 genomic scaffold, scaffold_383 n=1 Tax=Coffea canephora TaxID=49390 RepID=A0A068VEU5_COFCA|nr:unnamed protein product [Coffea canephora]